MAAASAWSLDRAVRANRNRGRRSLLVHPSGTSSLPGAGPYSMPREPISNNPATPTPLHGAAGFTRWLMSACGRGGVRTPTDSDCRARTVRKRGSCAVENAIWAADGNRQPGPFAWTTASTASGAGACWTKRARWRAMAGVAVVAGARVPRCCSARAETLKPGECCRRTGVVERGDDARERIVLHADDKHGHVPR